MLQAIAQIITWPISSPYTNVIQLSKFESFFSYWGPNWEPNYIYSPN